MKVQNIKIIRHLDESMFEPFSSIYHINLQLTMCVCVCEVGAIEYLMNFA
jgi:hypothetical protein